MLSEFFGILSHRYFERPKKYTKRFRDEIQLPGNSRGGELVAPRYTYLTQDFKLHSKEQKKIIGHGIAHIYVGICFSCIYRKICKCVEGWIVPLSILSRNVTLDWYPDSISSSTARPGDPCCGAGIHTERCRPSHDFESSIIYVHWLEIGLTHVA